MVSLLACATSASLLFLGNSLTFANDLDQKVASVLEEDGAAIDATRLAQAGWRFTDHRAAIENAEPAWDAALGDSGPSWTWGFLQEQSQIPGFPASEPMRADSVAAGAWLDGRLAEHGAASMLILTWAYKDGDSQNPDLFADFPTMQARLRDGYLGYRDAWSSDERPVWVAPAGLAFGVVHDRILAAGADPLDSGSDFAALYSGDGRHPAPAGSWLAAWTIYASLTGCPATGHALPAELDAALAARLQADADAAVFDGDAAIVFPWQVGAGDDDDAADDDSSDDDSAGGGVSDDDSTEAGADDDDSAERVGDCVDGCCCSSSRSIGAPDPSAAFGALLFGLVVLGFVRARQGP